ncbi:MAG: hypothetical protein H7201_01940 [Candidatus Saccharibacteria bacterium]|nr:hypothetical protein [Microbacteriaceae bacterium]
MKRFALLTTVLTAVLTLLLPFIGGGGPALTGSVSYASAAGSSGPLYASSIVAPAATAPSTTTLVSHRGQLAKSHATNAAYFTVDTEHLGQKPVPIPAVVAPSPDPPAAGYRASRGGVIRGKTNRGGSSSAGEGTADRSAAAPAAGTSCPARGSGGGSAPGGSESGVGGTTSADIQSFSAALNAIRAANCLQPIASGNFRYDSCMEQRLYWMAEDPSTNPGNTWGHTGVRSLAPDANGVYYSNSVPAKGCDGNLAGGSGNSGATVAQKWWDSLSHRASLYRPSVTSTAGVCIYFAMTHGGVPGENPGFARAAARWGGC